MKYKSSLLVDVLRDLDFFLFRLGWGGQSMNIRMGSTITVQVLATLIIISNVP